MNIAEQIARARIIKAFLSIVYFWSSPLNGQIVSQDFEGLYDLTEFMADNPDDGQVDAINLNLSNTGTPIFSLGEEDGNKFLQINKQGMQMRHFGRSSGIDNAPTLVIAFDFELKSVEPVESVESKKRIAGWFVGDDLGANSFHPEKVERWGEVGIFADLEQNEFFLTNHREEGEDPEESTYYSGKRRISIIANNSGAPILYDDPDGESTKISDKEIHIWVDKERELLGSEEPYLGTNAAEINAIKFMVWNTDIDAVYQIDNLVIGSLDAVPLPVTLLDFKAALLDRDVQLSWQTASEKNSSHFEIERSLDGKHFATLGQLPAAGSSQHLENYAYSDPEVTELMNPSLYYRLRMVDIDGTYEYSPVRVVEVSNIFRDFITVSPNPFNDQVMLKLQPGHGDLLYMELLDQKGAVIFHRQHALPAGSAEIRINSLEGLSSGMYFLKVRTAVTQRFLRLIKL